MTAAGGYPAGYYAGGGGADYDTSKVIAGGGGGSGYIGGVTAGALIAGAGAVAANLGDADHASGTGAIEAFTTQAPSAQAFDSADNPINGVTFTWTSANAAVATVSATGALLDYARSSGATRFVLASTGGVYGSGPEPIDESRQTAIVD